MQNFRNLTGIKREITLIIHYIKVFKSFLEASEDRESFLETRANTKSFIEN